MKRFLFSVACMFWASSAVASGCLKYGDVVSLYFKANDRILASELSGDATITRGQARQWEKFLVLDAQGKASGADVAMGNQIVLRSAHDRHLVAEPNGDVNANRVDIGGWEKWKIFPFDGTSPVGCVNLSGTSDQGPVALKSHHGRFLRASANGVARADLIGLSTNPLATNTSYIMMSRHPWTDFYYKRPISSKDGSCERCPDAGRWDGANCFVAEQGAQTGFAYGNDVYLQGGPTCVYGDYDGANCKLTSLSQGQKPFIYGGSLYARDACAPVDPIVVDGGNGRDCKPAVTVMSKETLEGLARLNAKAKWRGRVKTLYGKNYNRWPKARYRRVDCEYISSVTFNGYECTAIGEPCHKDN